MLNKWLTVLALMLLLLLLIAAISWPLKPSDGTNNTGEEIIRLHVMAHSDHPRDQALKNCVRDCIVDLLQSDLQTVQSIEEARSRLRQSCPRVVEAARQVVVEKGFDYPVQAVFKKSIFPTRMYGNQVYPAGQYEALLVIIGDGKGENWWCVLFPALCFPVAGMEEPHRATAIETSEPDQSNGKEKVEVRWKIWEWWIQKRQ